MEPLKIELLTRDGCRNTPAMRDNLHDALRLLQADIKVVTLDIGCLPGNDPRRGFSTPTVLVDSRDLFGLPTPTRPFNAPG